MIVADPIEELFAERFPHPQKVLGTFHDLYVYINGQFLRGTDARVSIWEHGLLYSDGVFEGIRAYNGRIFRLSEHLDRLFDSAQGLGITKIPLAKEEIAKVILACLRINRLTDAHIKPVITRGIGPMGMDPRRCPCPSVIVYAYPLPPLLGEHPVRLITSSVRRKSPHSIDAKIKSLAYIDNLLSKLQAISAGCDDALMLDLSGCVAEATGANIFAVRGREIRTPKAVAALPGITRRLILDVSSTLGYSAIVDDLTLQDLYAADEVFLTGTAVEIVPVAEIDGRHIKFAPGPAVRQFLALFREAIVREGIPYL